MHGHWESTTRKLNKHYQSAHRSGGIIPPDTYTYGDFYIGGSLYSTRYVHDEYRPSVGGEYYNYARVIDTPLQNLAECHHIRGLHKSNAYKSFFTDTQPFDPSVQPEAYQSYMAEVNAHRVGQCISNSSSMWQYTGERYFKYSLPTEAEATPYNVGLVQEGFYSLVKWKRETVPVAIDFSLSSIREAEQTLGLPSSQYISFEQVDAQNSRIYQELIDTISGKIYTRQAQGYAYVDLDQTILVRENNDAGGLLVSKIGRLYVFMRGRDLYIDMRLHIINPNTGADETNSYNCWLTALLYPQPLYAICTAGIYRQPTSEYYPTYPSPAQGGYDYQTFALDTLHYGAQYWHYYVNSNQILINQPMATVDRPLCFMATPISESAFNAAKGGLT